MELFDYYIFLDYSLELLGYILIERKNIEEIISKIRKVKHYKDVKLKKLYLSSIRKVLEDRDLRKLILKIKIAHMRHNLVVFTEVITFVKNNPNTAIFVSIDDHQYISFQRLVHLLDGNDVVIRKESELKKDSKEYRLSLIIDNLLNIERRVSK
jgi:hypothetical protein